MATTMHSTTARIDTLPADLQALAWDLFQDGMGLGEAVDAALGAGDLVAYAAGWDRWADAELSARYGSLLDEAEVVTPPPPPAARRKPAAPAVELEVRQVGGAYVVSSGSRPGLTHTVIRGVCSCEASRFNKRCRHLEAVERLTGRQAAA